MQKLTTTIILSAIAVLSIQVATLSAKTRHKNNPSITLSLVDPQATAETKALYANLWLIQQKGVMFGHHDYPFYGIGWTGDNDRSDVKDITGQHPAVFSLDMQRLNSAKIEEIKLAYKRGNVTMLVWHQNNPLTESDGAAYPAGTSWDNTPCVDQILIEGSDLNKKYKTRLDQVAQHLLSMKDHRGKFIPVIFRPLHEHTQDWNWWGRKATTQEEFIAFWQFIVSYLRDQCNVHHVIYCISPQMDESYPDAPDRLLYRWPGNQWVDMVGMDCYNGLNRDALATNIKALSALSQELQKPVGITEIGLEKNHTANYWTHNILSVIESYPTCMVVAWRNEKPSHAFGPYPEDASTPDFKLFFASKHTLFEKDLPNMYTRPQGVVVK